ncbi:unnamed protein product [Phyllotreta striolata]|uniref:PDZ domain-containing protein 8 n=1 Tax=Phyllotreta striolata TaxID=444603 RepID=A0A9P0GYS3_PHYSR|nr:unnamed protein product [Phyllotreta striolata]
MDIFTAIFLACISVLFGVILTLCVQYYILYVYLKNSPSAKPSLNKDPVNYSLPQALRKKLETEDFCDKEKGRSLPISLVLQFLFHELRHSEMIKRWLYKKLTVEFDELLTKTTIGKFFDSITIRDMHLGTEFPDIKDISVDEVKVDKKEGYIESVSLCVKLDYTGNFLLSVDGKMKFGKTAYLSIKVKRITGEARLEFSRQPYTHWSFSFYTDPLLELQVESHFQGRQLQSNITNLIVNQIKKAIKRKHTLPNYKLRYKPFFSKTDPSQLDAEDNEIVPQGQLEITCIEISRLSLPAGIQNIYCTMCLDTIPWMCLHQRDDAFYVTLEITISKARQAPLGVVFKQDQGAVAVESVSTFGAAYKSGLQPNDVVLAVDNRSVQTVPQVAKLIKSVAAANYTLKVERVAENYRIKSKYSADETERREPCPTAEVPEENELAREQSDQDGFVMVETQPKDTKKRVPKIIPSNENMAKFAQTIGNFSLRKRKTSLSDSGSAKTTPASSTPSTPSKQPQSFTHKKTVISDIPEITTTDMENGQPEIPVNIEVHKSKETPLQNSIVLQLNEDFQFALKEPFKYLNVNAWGTQENGDKDVLLGYANIPLNHVLAECCNSFLGNYTRCYSFLPPNNAPQSHPLLMHSGFEQVFCYGDVLLAFVWSHDDVVEMKRKAPEAAAAPGDGPKPTEAAAGAQHDFVRTQFHRTTHCDFCSKKIWLKDAVQCKQCSLCCHKKCIIKCQTSKGCNPNNKNEGSDGPEITMTEIGEDIAIGNGLKRVNSVNNLTIPGSPYAGGTSRSLPPSPQRTPSRKQSLTNANPFVTCPEVLDEVQRNPAEASDAIDKLLEQVMQCPNDETLMDAAKDTGRSMYAHLSHEERVEKMNLMMSELKKCLDSVTMQHMDLSKRMGSEDSEVEKAKLAFLMGKADAKVHGLSVLMLHYCSSLQHTQDKII